ncbi:MAG: helix-turn-helix transcriptional regulator [Verrucomicrobiae bacterium]|nr:helix-turn-helix transcriptional regulator [Verrucomicrobiae bacterium]
MNVRIGLRIRSVRLSSGLTIQELGAKLGISYQQVQKYETGSNRVSAEMLWRIAAVFEFPVSYFYGGGDAEARSTGCVLDDARSLAVARAMGRIGSVKTREAVAHLVDALGA